MAVFVLTFAFITLMVAAMAVGVIFSNKPIKGSCGGIQQLGMGGKCDICGGEPDSCDDAQALKKQEADKSKASYYPAD